MLGICSTCGNHEWDKEVEGNKIRCPKCGNEWTFEKLPIYFLTGCSGIGKTTTAIELQKLTDEYVILDVDWIRNIAWPQNDEEENDLIEQLYCLSKNITQSKRAVVWTMAGGIDRLEHTYGKRFFSEIKVLALTADPNVLRKRMTEGRGIEDAGWIQGSIDYNNYFRTHDSLGDTKFDTLDCTEGTPEEIAMKVLNWLRGCDSFTDDESKERLVWVDEKSDITYYPTFFREELKNPSNTVKHIVTDNRK